MKSSRNGIVSTVFVLLAVAVGLWLYPQLPPSVPTHWGLQGQVDGWSPRWLAVAIWPLLISLLAILAWLLPVISPRRFEIAPFAGIFNGLMLVLQAFALVVGVCAMLAGAGYRVPIPLVTTLAVGALFMVLGNYMGKLRRNFFIGIRTPWTLASAEVWQRTHRLGGWLFVLAGAAWIAMSPMPAARRVWPLLATAIAAAVIPCVYSYFVYRRVEAQTRPDGEGK
jgi:uncharacterized membrane protein